MPRSAEGRPLSYVALNGHGSYPMAAWIPRIFFAFNDQTSDKGVPLQHCCPDIYCNGSPPAQSLCACLSLSGMGHCCNLLACCMLAASLTCFSQIVFSNTTPKMAAAPEASCKTRQYAIAQMCNVLAAAVQGHSGTPGVAWWSPLRGSCHQSPAAATA